MWRYLILELIILMAFTILNLLTKLLIIFYYLNYSFELMNQYFIFCCDHFKIEAGNILILQLYINLNQLIFMIVSNFYLINHHYNSNRLYYFWIYFIQIYYLNFRFMSIHQFYYYCNLILCFLLKIIDFYLE